MTLVTILTNTSRSNTTNTYHVIPNPTPSLVPISQTQRSKARIRVNSKLNEKNWHLTSDQSPGSHSFLNPLTLLKKRKTVNITVYKKNKVLVIWICNSRKKGQTL